ncbi:rhombosortase [Agarivorans sp. B2Z047]|nr:rhombosortase [Agarivorans sp. B2Z047]
MLKYFVSRFWFLLIVISCSWFFLAHTELMSWNKQLISQGEYWRIVSGNLSHNNLIHWLMNVATLVLVYFVFDDRLSNQHFMLISISLCLLGGGLLWFAKYDEYVGLSGLIHGLIAYAAMADLFTDKKRVGAIILTGLSAKLLMEQLYGGDPWVTDLIGIDVAIDAHLLFAVLGISFALLLWWPLWRSYKLST